MTNRTLQTSQSFGLVAWLEKTRVELPLKGVECRFTVFGELLNVELDQIYHQNNSHPLDCVYTFPLPSGAAVFKCEMHVNGRVIRARVEEQGEARRIVQEKKAAGFRTALVETERENVFTLSLGNLQPEDVIVVRIAYFQTLTRLKDWTSLSIPFCPGIRYIPGNPLLRSNSGKGTVDDTDQVPDASRISPPRIERLHRDAAYLHLEGAVENSGGTFTDLSSPSHAVVVRDRPNGFEISLAESGAVPDSDFVLRWTDRAHDKLTPLGWVRPGATADYALLRLQAPAAAAVNDNYVQDVYFLIDRSGSMQGLKWEKAAQAFLEFLRVLGPKDRAWATLFDTRFQDVAEKPLPPGVLLEDKAVREIAKIGSAGGTQLLAALTHVLEKVEKFSNGRPASLILITDGQVGNEAAILELLAQRQGLRVHTFGIDTAVNDAFLKALARQQNGQCHLLTPQDDIAGAVTRLGDRLRRPVLTEIRVIGPWQSPAMTIPDLFAGEVLNLPLKGKASDGRVIVEGKIPGVNSAQYTFDLIENKSSALPRFWARQRIEYLLGKNQTAEAIVLAKRHNLICTGAAFVAWDEEKKVAVAEAEREVYQPSMIPAIRAGSAASLCYEMSDVDRSVAELRKGASRDFRSLLQDTFSAPLRQGITIESRSPGIPEGSDKGMLALFHHHLLARLTSPSWQARMRSDLAKVLEKELAPLPAREGKDRAELLSVWCEGMFAPRWLRNSEGWKLLQTLCRWALQDPSQWNLRYEQLIGLLGLAAAGHLRPPELKAWLQGNLIGDLQSEATAILDALEVISARPLRRNA